MWLLFTTDADSPGIKEICVLLQIELKEMPQERARASAEDQKQDLFDISHKIVKE